MVGKNAKAANRVDELTPIVNKVAMELKGEGQNVTVSALKSRIASLSEEWEHYKDLERDIELVIDRLRQQKFDEKARIYYKEIEQDDEKKDDLVSMVKKLRDRFLKDYKEESGRHNLIGLDKDSALIANAIENVLREFRKATLEDILTAWQEKVENAEEYKRLLDIPEELLIEVIHQKEYVKDKRNDKLQEDCEWMLDSKYVRLAIYRLFKEKADDEMEKAEKQEAEAELIK